MTRMTEPVAVHLVHTFQLGGADRLDVRDLLDAAFAGGFGGFDEHDWEHCLGGMHVLLWEGSQLVGHAAVVQRRLLHSGRALRAGYVEAVAVRADRRRLGHATALMDRVHDVIRGAYDLGALSAGDQALTLYTGLGWQVWRGPTWALTPDGRRRTPEDDGGVLVLPAPPAGAAGTAPRDLDLDLDLDGDLTCDWRDGDVW